MTLESRLGDLRTRLREIADLRAASALLSWDQLTHMPPGGAGARGRQLATLSRLAHERFTDPAIGRLLDALEPLRRERGDDDRDARLLAVVRRDYERAVRVPGSFLAEVQEHLSGTYGAWTEARPADDFARLRPRLERTLELSRRYAAFFDADHPADPLIEDSDEGMTVAALRPLFAELRAGLVPLVEAVVAARPDPGPPLRGPFPSAVQQEVGLELARRFGYDLRRGRQDESPHPFAVAMSVDDVRITTRTREDELSEGIYSTLHEAGHAMYEQGIDPALDGTPLAAGVSSGVHESQSRLWENLVGRSRAFLEHAYPELQRAFPEALAGVGLERFHRAVNRVAPSLIRTEADELTYNLHVVIRFDLECALLEGELEVRDLPEAWRARYARDLGVAPEDDRDGVLQDVHWYGGLIGGAFQGYAIGNVLSAQFYDAAVAAEPSIPEGIPRGEFGALHGWLREHVHRPGRTFPPSELVRRATGRELDVAPYLAYLRRKYGALAGLQDDLAPLGGRGARS